MMRVYDLKAGHSRRVLANNNPTTHVDPTGLFVDAVAQAFTKSMEAALSAGSRSLAYTGRTPVPPHIKAGLIVFGIAADLGGTEMGHMSTSSVRGAAAQQTLELEARLLQKRLSKIGTKQSPCDGESRIALYRGSINNYSDIRYGKGLQYSGRGGSRVTTDLIAAIDAIANSRRVEVSQGLSTDAGVIISLIGQSDYNLYLAPKSRPYTGWSGTLRSSEIVVDTPTQMMIFNAGIVGGIPRP